MYVVLSHYILHSCTVFTMYYLYTVYRLKCMSLYFALEPVSKLFTHHSTHHASDVTINVI